MTYDPELPRGYQDADIEQAELEAAGRRASRLRRAGVCVHGGWQGYTPEHRPDLKPGQVECQDGCGRVFDSEAELLAARMEVLHG